MSFWRITALLVLGFLQIISLNGCKFWNETESSGNVTGLEKKTTLKVTNWNVETFFDSVNDGSEYSEFVNSKSWGKELYVNRLKRLCDAIKVLDCDVLIMEEIENAMVLQDISNFLAGEWNSRKLYSYAGFGIDKGSSIGIGVLSRYPLSDVQLHTVDVRTEDKCPSMRPILQVQVSKDGRQLVLLMNHWKSMSGGSDETEQWRNRQEALMASVAGKLLMEGKSVLAAGDFNRDIEKFCLSNSYDFLMSGSAAESLVNAVFFRKFRNGALCEEGIHLYSPWILSSGNFVNPGSYFFKGNWSRIDNFFYSGNVEVLNFTPETGGPWCREEDYVPIGYEIWSGEGYSDHLPISCVVKF